MKIKWDTALEGCTRVIQTGETKMQSYLCDCLMKVSGQPHVDLSWPAPDNLVPLSSLINIYWRPAMGLITNWHVWFMDIFMCIPLVFFTQLYAHPQARTCTHAGIYLNIHLSSVKQRVHNKLLIKR